MNFFICCLLFASLSVSIQADNSPVLMYFKKETFDNTVTIGQVLKASELNLYLNKIQSAVDIIFVDNLKDEDLRILLKQQEMPVKTVHYEPLVESPAETLSAYLDLNPSVKANLESVDSASKALNEFITKVTSSKSDAVLLMSSANKSRSRRQATPSNNTINYQYVYGVNCSAMYSNIYMVDQSVAINSNHIDLNVTGSTFTCQQDSAVLSFTFDGSDAVVGNHNVTKLDLVFSAPNTSQYWTVDNNSSMVRTTNGDYGVYYYGTPYSMETPLTFSFVCTRTYFQLFNKTVSTLPLAKVSLYIEHLQIQPFNQMVNGSNYTFGRVNYCQGFFSSGIWMAITSSLILTAILAFGVTFLFNINTMDRFDDPKGKPLTIALEK